MKFYVYQYCDPKSEVPFYVGKGCGSRAYKHLTECKRLSHGCFDGFFYRKLRKMLSLDTPPIIKIVRDQLSEREALDFEVLEIKRIGRRNLNEGPLTNLTNGGEGVSGHIVSNQTKQQMRSRQLGKSPSVETRCRIREARLGAKHTEESKRRMREHSPATHYRRAVCAFDSFGNQIYQFDSIKNALKGGFNSSGVSHCLSGHQKTYKGLYWRYSHA